MVVERLPFSKILLRIVICAVVVSCLFSPSLPARAQINLGISDPVPLASGAADGAAIWGDIDNDNDQDLLVTGRGNGEMMVTLLLRNNGGTLSQEGSAGLPGVESSSLALGDYDNDGDLDVAITGQSGVNLQGEIGLARIYANDGTGAFTLAQTLTGVYRGWADWGDYDQDGDLDLLMAGYQNGGAGFGALYRNDHGTFNLDTGVSVPAVGDSYVAWGDYDADKDLDFVILGKACETCTQRIAQVMRNDAGVFTLLSLTQNGLWNGAAAWIDVDNDSDLDLILSGNNGPDNFNRDPQTLFFLNDNHGGLVLSSSAGLPPLWQTSISTGDYDNDGDADLLLSGLGEGGSLTQIYTNTGGVFSNAGVTLNSGTGASVAWGQLDGDGSLDIAVTGVEDSGGVYSTFVYLNVPTTPNTDPTPPVIQAACWDTENSVFLDWSEGSDEQTPSPALTYSLRVGTTPGAVNIVSPPAGEDGYRRLSVTDGSSTKSNAVIKGLANGTYYWSVQSVDASYAGSRFSAEGIFKVGVYIAVNDDVWVDPTQATLLPVLENDNANFGGLEIYSVQDPDHGYAEIVGDSISYTPDPDWAGIESFEYYALSPSTGYCSRGIVTTLTPGIYLNGLTIKDGLPVGTPVGAFRTTFVDPTETYTYMLVSGEGDQDNGSFSIAQNKLLTAEVFDYSVKSEYSIRVKALGNLGHHFWRSFTISVRRLEMNPPEDVFLSYSAVQENAGSDVFVGAFSCADPDAGDTCTYMLVDGPGRQDNATFAIDGSNLRALDSFDFETKSSYSILVRATDRTGLGIQKVFQISVINLSDNAPVNLLLSNNEVVELKPVNTFIGAFTAEDTDPADTFRYQLVSGEGSADNSSFNIYQNFLRSSFVFDSQARDTYTIRVRVTDQTNRFLEKIFTIKVIAAEKQYFYLPVIVVGEE